MRRTLLVISLAGLVAAASPLAVPPARVAAESANEALSEAATEQVPSAQSLIPELGDPPSLGTDPNSNTPSMAPPPVEPVPRAMVFGDDCPTCGMG